MIVISDTSPLNYLILIGQVEVLQRLFGRVIVPPGVLAELNQPGSPEAVSKWSQTPPAWLEVLSPQHTVHDPSLGTGEAEAIGLAQELHADVVLIDERKAWTVARQLGLTVTGTLGVLTLAATRDLLDLPTAITALRKTNFREPTEIVEELLRRDAVRKSAGA